MSEKNAPKVRKRGSTLKRGKGFAVASVQREKVRPQSCIVCGLDRHEATIDPAHIWDRGRGGCDHILCVVALCRQHHELYDRHEIDLLPHLINHGLYEEMAHPIRAHGVSPLTLLERLTGETWEPKHRDRDYSAMEAEDTSTYWEDGRVW